MLPNQWSGGALFPGYMTQAAENGTPHPTLFWLWNASVQIRRDVSATPHSPGMLHMELTTTTKGVGHFSVAYKTNRKKPQKKSMT